MAARKWCGDWCVGGGCGGLRVATGRRFISSKIDALRSPASTAQCDATAKKGHVNYDLSNVPVKVRAAPTTGSGCHVLYWHARDDAKNSSFFGGSARRRKRDTHPADAIVGTERVGRGLGKGGESCWRGRQRRALWRTRPRCQDDGNCIIVASIFDGCGTFFTPRERQTPGFRDVVARANDTPVPLRRQNRERNFASWGKISHRGQF